MSSHTAGTAAPDAGPAAVRARDLLIAVAAALVALLALYAVFVDNGHLVSATGEYLHEFSHDGRHLFGAPCH
ncbi:CbtB domain-containing protein [Streptomyces xiaopingdaonensis]|uniref:CbtB domain-containing protein n=1 Tax=Streptomyces xiaopingdaonensis TaxID=1565415 RepID=UPI00030DAB1E|nr:CbtB-domain containing protein [Streptomyces xiaopingdaonensis]